MGQLLLGQMLFQAQSVERPRFLSPAEMRGAQPGQKAPRLALVTDSGEYVQRIRRTRIQQKR